jgi:hypothetical protein
MDVKKKNPDITVLSFRNTWHIFPGPPIVVKKKKFRDHLFQVCRDSYRGMVALRPRLSPLRTPSRRDTACATKAQSCATSWAVQARIGTIR